MEHKSYETLRQELEAAEESVTLRGVYRHYKDAGSRYVVMGFTVIEATDQVAVRYSPEGARDVEFVRPLHGFVEVVEVNGEPVPRFELI